MNILAPPDAYYEIETARAVENFPLSVLRAPVEAMTRPRPGIAGEVKR